MATCFTNSLKSTLTLFFFWLVAYLLSPYPCIIHAGTAGREYEKNVHFARFVIVAFHFFWMPEILYHFHHVFHFTRQVILPSWPIPYSVHLRDPR